MRFLYGLLFAVPFALVSFAWVEAYSPPVETPSSDPGCRECHPAFVEAWSTSAHGQATSDPLFQEAWENQGQSEECLPCHVTGYDEATGTWAEDGITCAACHSPMPDKHPLQPMPTDRSEALCGTCHVEAVFEWQVSEHRANDLTCVACHGQHSTNLKTGDPSALCASCHRDRSSNYAHTAHSEEGMSCADCHLGPLDGSPGEGHAFRDHSFNVRLGTCNSCHAYQMHDPVEVHTDREAPQPVVKPMDFETAGLDIEPEPVNPFSFALLAGLIGMAAGVILSPWLERWYGRLGRKDRQGKE